MSTKIQNIFIALALIAGFAQSASATVTFSVAPASVSNTYDGTIILQIGGLTNTETVVVQKYLDLNTNGIIDGGDWLVQQFVLTDGQTGMAIGGVTNFNVPGDLNIMNGAITASLNFPGGDIRQKVIGKYLYKMSSPVGHFGPITNQFAVTNFPFAQKFTGNVLSNNTSVTVPNAVIIIFPPGASNPPEEGAVANNAGIYNISIPPGAYGVTVLKSNFLALLPNAPVINLNSGQTVTTNLAMTNSTASISGSVVDASNPSVGLPGVMVAAKLTNGLFTVAFTDTNGNYNLPVSTGIWQIKPDNASLLVLGYVGPETWSNASGGSTAVTFTVAKATALIYGSVLDDFGNPLPSLDIYTYDENGLYSSDGCYTDTNGNYVLGILGQGDNDYWSVQANGDDQITNYLFPQQTNNGYVNAGQAIQQNFTALLATNRITGWLKDNNNNPIAGINIYGYENTPVNGLYYQGYGAVTDTNGNYSLNVASGSWDIGVDTSGDMNSLSVNYIAPNDQYPDIANNNAVVNFIAPLINYYTNTSGVFSYTINGGTITIIGFSFLGQPGAIAIPGTIGSVPVEAIGDSSFEDCTGLANLTIPNSIASIGGHAFYYCASLTNVTIPASVTNIGNETFGDCANLAAINVAASNPVYSSAGGVLFNKSQTVLIEYPAGLAGIYTVPNSVAAIEDYAFDSCYNLTGVQIGANVTSIGIGAFQYCLNLTSVGLGSSVTNISSGAFYECYELTSITIPSSVLLIGGNAFATDNNTYQFVISLFFLGNAPNTDNTGIFYNRTLATAYYLSGSIGWSGYFGGYNGGGISSGGIPTGRWVVPPQILNGTNNLAYSQQLTASYGQSPYSWALVSGSLPSGLTLAANGLIAGTPTVAGPVNIIVKVTDAISASVAEPVSFVIKGPHITTVGLLYSGTNGAVYEQQLTATYGQTPYNWSLVSGSLPTGLSLAADGILSGIPQTNGTFNITVAVSDALSMYEIKSFTIGIALFQITTYALPYATNGVAYGQQFSAINGQPPYTWTIISGSLPAGLTLATNGLLSGSALFSENANFTVKVTDSISLVATQSMTLTVLINVIYDFALGGGSEPDGNLLLSGGTLYGATYSGAVYKVNTDGSGFAVLTNTVYNALNGLVLSSNYLYGAQLNGGSSGSGTIFKINTNGTGLAILYNFSPYNNIDVNSDGYRPNGSLVLSGNTLYGTAQDGGSGGRGTIFKINTDGTGFTNLHNISYYGGDGINPNGGLILSGNTLYGTTLTVGSNNFTGSGTVFRLNTDGSGFTNVYAFTPLSGLSPTGTNSDGAFPQDGLVLSGNTLYGTTRNGGAWGWGTVFSVRTDGGGFTNLYNFTGGSDGNQPFSKLVLSGNILYGTTSGGYGNIFQIYTNGAAFKSLYNFTGTSDGYYPFRGLIYSSNTLFGVTQNGGNANDGIVFSFSLGLTGVPFTANPASGLVPLTVNFTSRSVDSFSNNITTWFWNFGDGAISAVQNPSHTYIATGTYSPMLQMTNSLGGTVVGYGPSILVTNPTINYTASPTNGTPPLIVQFNSPSVDSIGMTITKWNWNFGDGTTANIQNPSHTYTATGIFSPVIIATNSVGSTVIGSGPSILATNPVVQFSANPTNGAPPLAVQFNSPSVDNAGKTIAKWNWYFGDGASANTQNPSHTYTVIGAFQPMLMATNSAGIMVIGYGPQLSTTNSTIQFTAAPTNTTQRAMIQFSAPSVDSAGVSVTNWAWNFGDGTFTNIQNPPHSYNAVGTFLPTLLATNSLDNAVYAAGPQIIITNTTIQFVANPTTTTPQAAVQFTSLLSDSAGLSVTKWNWNFGDGGLSNIQNPSHSYGAAGIFLPTLTVTNSLGNTVTGFGPEITVTNSTVQFSASPTNGTPPLSVQFSSPSVDSVGRTINKWSWSFGDGTFSATQSPLHTYTNTGAYFPALIATNNFGVAVIGYGPSIFAVFSGGLVVNGGLKLEASQGGQAVEISRPVRLAPVLLMLIPDNTAQSLDLPDHLVIFPRHCPRLRTQAICFPSGSTVQMARHQIILLCLGMGMSSSTW